MATRPMIALAACVGLLCAAISWPIAHAAEIKVLSTVAVQPLLEELAPEFERETGHRLAMTFGVSNTMKRQIDAGEHFDVAIMTSPVTDALIEQGRVVATTRTDIARGGIGIGVRQGASKPDIASVEALKRTLLAAESVAFSREGWSGLYFAGLLEQLGIAEAMQPKIRYGAANVGEMVAGGEAQLGVQLINELMAVTGVEVVGPLPAEVQNHVILTGGVGTQAGDPAAAEAFLRFLTAPAAAPLIRSKGLEPGPTF
jgi:molybdate transport system substrate-binding protein